MITITPTTKSSRRSASSREQRWRERAGPVRGRGRGPGRGRRGGRAGSRELRAARRRGRRARAARRGQRARLGHPGDRRLRQRWAEPGGDLSRLPARGRATPATSARSSARRTRSRDGPVVLGPGCADPYSPKAVRASMGSLFARPPARARLRRAAGHARWRSIAHGGAPLGEAELEPPVVLCLGAEREGLPGEVLEAAEAARDPAARRRPESLNVAMAATRRALRAANRMAAPWLTCAQLRSRGARRPIGRRGLGAPSSRSCGCATSGARRS